MIDSVTCKKEASKTREGREVSECGKVVIREINSVLVLEPVSFCARKQLARRWDLAQSEEPSTGGTHAGLTLAMPRFSMAGILCPIHDAQKLISIQLLFQGVVPVLFRQVSSNQTHLGDPAHGL